MPQKICCQARHLIQTKRTNTPSMSNQISSFNSSFKIFQSTIERNESILGKVDNQISNTSIQNMFKINQHKNDTFKQQERGQSFFLAPTSQIIDKYINNSYSNFYSDDKKMKSNIYFHKEIKQQVEKQLTQKKQEKTTSFQKKNLKKSNALKNFANQFVVYFSQQQNVELLLQKYNINFNQYKNIVDNMKKKIKYLKRAQKIQDIKSMLQHSIKSYQNALLQSCQLFLDIYPRKVQQSLKMKDTDGNLRIISVITNLITQIKKDH